MTLLVNSLRVFDCVKQLTFLVDGSEASKRALYAHRLRELWKDGTINAESNLFLTARDEANKVKCFPLRGADIQENLESGEEDRCEEFVRAGDGGREELTKGKLLTANDHHQRCEPVAKVSQIVTGPN